MKTSSWPGNKWWPRQTKTFNVRTILALGECAWLQKGEPTSEPNYQPSKFTNRICHTVSKVIALMSKKSGVVDVPCQQSKMTALAWIWFSPLILKVFPFAVGHWELFWKTCKFPVKAACPALPLLSQIVYVPCWFQQNLENICIIPDWFHWYCGWMPSCVPLG